MKKLFIPAMIILLASCGGDAETNSVATDSSVHPSGVNEGAVISTDTAAYRVPDTALTK